MTPQIPKGLSVEYVPTPADALQVRRYFHRHALRYPPLAMMLFGCVALAVGAALMGVIGSAVWLALSVFGLLLLGMMLLAWRMAAPTPEKVEREYAARQWLRTPFRVAAELDGVDYEHGPFSARLTWAAFAKVAETGDALMLLEKPSAGALVYGLAKRELDRAGGATSWRHFIDERLRGR